MLAFAFAASLVTMGQLAPGQFSTRVTIESKLPYLVSLPDGYAQDETKRWPLLVFLHGAGERGTDLEKVKTHGPPKEIANGKSLPFIVAAPQCPERDWWSNPVQVETLSKLIDHLEAKYRVDRDRIYLTGLSMGGFGTWALAAAEPKRFAAIAPICGIGDPAQAPKLAGVPIWAVHGEKDAAVPFAEGRRTVEAARAAGALVRFDALPEGGHDVWTAFYQDDAFYAWLLTHKRRK